MEIQDVPLIKVADKDGNMTVEFRQWLSKIMQQMQANLSDDGFRIPRRSDADIRGALGGADYTSNFVYDNDVTEYVGNKNGVLVKFTTTPL